MMEEQIIGHLTALGILIAQTTAREALKQENPREFLEEQRIQALGVAHSALISVTGMDSQKIKEKALEIIEQTFDAIIIDENPKRKIDRKSLN